jgi:predicted RNA binding protein YcfA (HicA-like mRNA interferase family)
MRAGQVLSFADVVHLVEALGFRLVRQRGSHRIYKHPGVRGALVLQPLGKEAKDYQVRQTLDMLLISGLIEP